MKHLSSDKALAKKENDYLGYQIFAEKIGILISNAPNDGFVISIKGSWGIGKSTLLNFVKTNLYKEHEFNIIDFNPWKFSGISESFIIPFLKTIESECNLETKSKKTKEFANRISEKITKVSEAVGGIGGGIGALTGSVLGDLTKYDIIKAVNEVSHVFEENDVTTIIIVDDIDRLNGEEILDLFKIIKNLANFQNVIYVLAFDENKVLKALDKTLNYSGIAYLEKIIQYSFHIPLPKPLILFRQLTHKLDLIAAENKMNFDHHYWKNLYQNAFYDIITTPRDVTRIVNSVAIALPTVAKYVNLPDFVAIEIIRNYLPQIYFYIQKHPHFFAYNEEHKSLKKIFYTKHREQVKLTHKNWVSLIEEKDQQIIVKSLIGFLFPKIELELNNKSSKKNNWDKNKFICSPIYFDTYFTFSYIGESIHNVSIQEILAIIENIESLKSKIYESSQHDSMLLELLVELNKFDYTSVKQTQLNNLVVGFLSIREQIEDYPEYRIRLSYHKTIDLLAKLVARILTYYGNKESNATFLSEVLAQCGNSLSIHANILLHLTSSRSITKTKKSELNRNFLELLNNSIEKDSFFSRSNNERVISYVTKNNSQLANFRKQISKKVTKDKLFVGLINSLTSVICNDGKIHCKINEEYVNVLLGNESKWLERIEIIITESKIEIPLKLLQLN